VMTNVEGNKDRIATRTQQTGHLSAGQHFR
jgi:hypothetical protein